MVADGRLSMTHDRPANFDEITAWATYSPTGDNLSIGQPDCFKPASNPVCDNDLDGDSDGGYSWTKGPVIELAGFDFSAGGGLDIVNVSLAVAFRVSNLVLPQRRVIAKSSWGKTLSTPAAAKLPPVLGPVPQE